MSKKAVSYLAGRLKALRQAAGLTQQQLAFQAGLSMSLVTQLEQGLKADPRLSTLLALSRVLGVSLDALGGGAGEGAAPTPVGEAPAGGAEGKGRAKGKRGTSRQGRER